VISRRSLRSFEKSIDRAKRTDWNQLEIQNANDAQRQTLQKNFRFLFRSSRHDEYDALAVVPMPELVEFTVEIELHRRGDLAEHVFFSLLGRHSRRCPDREKFGYFSLWRIRHISVLSQIAATVVSCSTVRTTVNSKH
jgi:hypothetical protein